MLDACDARNMFDLYSSLTHNRMQRIVVGVSAHGKPIAIAIEYKHLYSEKHMDEGTR